MTYWRLFYHIVWATKGREPLVTLDLEPDLRRVIVGKAQELGAMVHATGGIEDHVHIAVSTPPKLAIADFVAQLKGSSSHFANHRQGAAPFAWQPEYGVLSFDGKKLDLIVKYIHNQRQHHRDNSIFPGLERTSAESQNVNM